MRRFKKVSRSKVVKFTFTKDALEIAMKYADEYKTERKKEDGFMGTIEMSFNIYGFIFGSVNERYLITC